MKPAFVGICGSGKNVPIDLKICTMYNSRTILDLHEYTSGPVLVPETEHPITGEKRPITMGHEFSGIIEEVGEDVKGLSRGQRAVVRPTIYDEKCAACKQGCRHCCKNIGFIGLSGIYFLTSPSHTAH